MNANVENVVLTYPYEGGLYYLLSRENPSHVPSEKGHPYYEALYGPNPEATQHQAVNLLTLFNQVLLAPADEYLPDYRTYSTAQQYYNPHLRLLVDRAEDFSREASQIAAALLKEQAVIELLASSTRFPKGDWEAEFFVGRAIQQLRLALTHNAAIVGGAAIGELLLLLWRLVGRDISSGGVTQPPTIAFTEDIFDAIALTWHCKDVEALVNIRTSPEICAYSASFREAVFNASQKDNLKNELLNLMHQAMDSEAIASKAKGAVEIAGLGTTVIGMIPVVGNLAAAASLGEFLYYKQLERKETSARWYLLGNKIREVDLKAVLSKPRSTMNLL